MKQICSKCGQEIKKFGYVEAVALMYKHLMDTSPPKMSYKEAIESLFSIIQERAEI